MTKQEFIKQLQLLNINITPYQLEQFNIYYELLIEWNQKMNLTAITDEMEVYEKHFYDSILCANQIELNHQNICDVGAGAGFPSIPLKIIYPHLNITIVDSLGKRITFLNELITQLKLDNVTPVLARAEEHAILHYQSYDLVLARAVARLNILCELCLPLVKKKGYFIALKGKQGLVELQEAQNAIKTLNGKIISHNEYTLVNDNSQRMIIMIQKQGNTSKAYPRKYAQIKNKPL